MSAAEFTDSDLRLAVAAYCRDLCADGPDCDSGHVFSELYNERINNILAMGRRQIQRRRAFRMVASIFIVLVLAFGAVVSFSQSIRAIIINMSMNLTVSHGRNGQMFEDATGRYVFSVENDEKVVSISADKEMGIVNVVIRYRADTNKFYQWTISEYTTSGFNPNLFTFWKDIIEYAESHPEEAVIIEFEDVQYDEPIIIYDGIGQ